MSDDLKFDLPARTRPRNRGHWALTVVAVVLAWAVGFFVRPARIGPNGKPSSPPGGAGALLDHAELVSLAETLEKNQIYGEAARVWQQAAELAPPKGPGRAELLFRIGKNLSLAGEYEPAVAYLFAAETADRDGKWKESINALVLEGLSALGREDARAFQAARRTSLASRPDDAGSRPVAEIGGEPITELDLQSFARRMVTAQLAPQRNMMTADAFRKLVEAQLESFRTPEGRRQLLDAYLGQELLYREALAGRQFDRKEVQEQIAEVRRQILGNAFVDDYVGRNLHVSDTDVQNAYEAHKAEYVEPEAVKVEVLAVDTAEAKKQASDALDAGTDFAKVRERFSAIQATPGEPALFDEWMTREARVPLAADSKAVLAHLWTLDKGEVSKKWFEGEGGRWLRFRLVEHRKERPLTLAECRDRVERDLRLRKQEELLRELQRSLEAKYKVVVHEAEPTKGSDGGAAKGPPTTRK
ncbi:MAG: peptidyl-prolyl cis-trans isomerase [Phycisphaerae bacterium]